MPQILPVALRVNSKAVGSLAGGMFSGALTATMLPVDVNGKLTFRANVAAFTGDVNTPSVVFTPADDNGNVKVFGNIDDLIKWLRSAYLDIVSLNIEVDSMELITKKFVPPTDPLANAVKQKTVFEKLKAGLADNINLVNTKVAAAVASGWNAVNAHPALKANYDELIAKKTAVDATAAYFDAKIAEYAAIIAG